MKTMYYIAVLPPLTVREEIKAFKEEVRDRFLSKHALRSPAHITLQMPFHFEESEEETLIFELENLAKQFNPITCDLNGFDHFGNRVVFVSVMSNPELKNYRKSLQELLKSKFHFSARQLPERFHPHITIANRDLSPAQFGFCYDAFRDRDYQRTFSIQGLVLLKHRGDHWEVYREFPFN